MEKKRTIRKDESKLVTVELPKVSFACLKLPGLQVAILKVNTMATQVFTQTAAFLPAFFSNFDERTFSSRVDKIFCVEGRSCRGRSLENSSIAVSTTEVPGGGGSERGL